MLPEDDPVNSGVTAAPGMARHGVGPSAPVQLSLLLRKGSLQNHFQEATDITAGTSQAILTAHGELQ